jgi:hypothetical protein
VRSRISPSVAGRSAVFISRSLPSNRARPKLPPSQPHQLPAPAQSPLPIASSQKPEHPILPAGMKSRSRILGRSPYAAETQNTRQRQKITGVAFQPNSHTSSSLEGCRYPSELSLKILRHRPLASRKVSSSR